MLHLIYLHIRYFLCSLLTASKVQIDMDTSLSAAVNGQLDREFLSLLPDSQAILREDMLARSKYLDHSLKIILSMLHQIHVLLVFSRDWLGALQS